MIPQWEKDDAVKAMRTALFYIEGDRERAQALDNLGALLRCELPGTVSKVHVKGRRWWRTTALASAEREVVLSDTERREFRDWCEERAKKLREHADEAELRIAMPANEEES